MFPRPLHCAGSWARGGAPSRSPSRYYTEGVYQSGPSSPGTDGWQRVDHAVLLVGWGEEKGVKCAGGGAEGRWSTFCFENKWKFYDA